MGMKPVPSFSTFDRRSVWRFTVSKVLSGFCWEWAKEDRRGDGREIARVFRRPSSLFNGDIALLASEAGVRGEWLGVALGERPVSFQQVWVLSLAHVPGMANQHIFLLGQCVLVRG